MCMYYVIRKEWDTGIVLICKGLELKEAIDNV